MIFQFWGGRYQVWAPSIRISGYFWIRNFFFPDSKIFTSTHVSVFKSNLPVHTYPTRIRIHSSTQDSSGNVGNRAGVVKRAKFASCSAFHGEELGLILLRHRIKKYQDLATTRSRINSVFKTYISTLESGFKKLRIRIPDSPNTWQ